MKGGPMRSETGTQQFDKRTMRQVASDAMRAIARQNYFTERSVLEHLQCVDCQPECETEFGRQLWYFDATVVDEQDRQSTVYGAIEYSIQYELNEVVDDSIFLTPDQRNRFEEVYRREPAKPNWRHPAHLWLLAGVVLLATGYLSVLLLQKLLQ